MTKIDIISGFLGAGKTTLIKKLLQEAFQEEQVVLIENEFGEIGIDGGFLKEAGIEIREMNSGCICCSLVGDFGASLKEVIDKYHPDRILIEPSGVGKLSDVIRAVKDVQEETGLVLNSYTTVVDAKKCKMYMRNFGEFFNNQVEYAGAIIMSRTDIVDDEKAMQSMELLRGLNAKAAIITTPIENLDGKKLLEVMEHPVSLEQEMMDEEVCPECGHVHEHGEHHHHHEHHDHLDGKKLLEVMEHPVSLEQEMMDEEVCPECGHVHEHGEHHHHHEHHDHECECGHDHEHEHPVSLEQEMMDEEVCPECGHVHEHGEHHHHHEHHDHECECGHDHEHHHEHHDHECGCGHDHEHHHDHECGCGHDHHHHHADEVFTSWGRETIKKYSREDLEKILEILSHSEEYGVILRAEMMDEEVCPECGHVHEHGEHHHHHEHHDHECECGHDHEHHHEHHDHECECGHDHEHHHEHHDHEWIMNVNAAMTTSITMSITIMSVNAAMTTSIIMSITIMNVDAAMTTSITIMNADADMIITIIMQTRCLQAGGVKQLRSIPERIWKRFWRSFLILRSME